MADESSSIVIDPSSYDLIVVGTGLPESVLAAAAASAGKSVLHLDPNSFYASHFASLPLSAFSSFLLSQLNIPSEHSQSSHSDSATVADLIPRSLYSHVDFSYHSLQQPSGRFSLDLSGPRLLLSADPIVDLLLRSGASNYLEFRSVSMSFMYLDGRLLPVPHSREAVFKDRSLGLTEKTHLMRFFKLAREHFGSEGERISEEDMESPFIEFLEKQRLPPKIKAIILYVIAMADYDQECPELSKKLVKTKDGMESLALHSSSVGRFSNGLGAYIYPIYGQGELPQAFCRCAAVRGALYVLSMPVTALLTDSDYGHYKGVRLASGQDLFGHQLIVDPSFTASPLFSGSLDLHHESFESSNMIEVRHGSSPGSKVARGVCIIRSSIQPDLSNLMVVFPPRSLYTEQLTSVRALQLGSNVAICPPGLFILYLSTLCDDAAQGKKSLHAAINALFPHPAPKNFESSSQAVNEVEADANPIVLWSAMYVQELTESLIAALYVGHSQFLLHARWEPGLQRSSGVNEEVVSQNVSPRRIFP
ncbi:rab escort protein 1-like isoform X2 [Magnolia sinica]|uniref:rab escort protein 1-like isoform X2 n=1 Tax=Magnolia sinica TaxID=86752 RepID=UPI002657B222|nr:rab escort protein 1-like isoform X2 [Magnolia sinica]